MSPVTFFASLKRITPWIVSFQKCPNRFRHVFAQPSQLCTVKTSDTTVVERCWSIAKLLGTLHINAKITHILCTPWFIALNCARGFGIYFWSMKHLSSGNEVDGCWRPCRKLVLYSPVVLRSPQSGWHESIPVQLLFTPCYGRDQPDCGADNTGVE